MTFQCDASHLCDQIYFELSDICGWDVVWLAWATTLCFYLIRYLNTKQSLLTKITPLKQSLCLSAAEQAVYSGFLQLFLWKRCFESEPIKNVDLALDDQRIIRVISIHPEGNMNVWITFHHHPSNSCFSLNQSGGQAVHISMQLA